MAVVGMAAVPLLGLAPHAAGETIAAHRQTEGFGVLSSTQAACYALAGVLIALLPVHRMLLAGDALGVLVLVLIPIWNDCIS